MNQTHIPQSAAGGLISRRGVLSTPLIAVTAGALLALETPAARGAMPECVLDLLQNG